jgi:hypothetical protein
VLLLHSHSSNAPFLRISYDFAAVTRHHMNMPSRSKLFAPLVYIYVNLLPTAPISPQLSYGYIIYAGACNFRKPSSSLSNVRATSSNRRTCNTRSCRSSQHPKVTPQAFPHNGRVICSKGCSHRVNQLSRQPVFRNHTVCCGCLNNCLFMGGLEGLSAGHFRDYDPKTEEQCVWSNACRKLRRGRR